MGLRKRLLAASFGLIAVFGLLFALTGLIGKYYVIPILLIDLRERTVRTTNRLALTLDVAVGAEMSDEIKNVIADNAASDVHHVTVLDQDGKTVFASSTQLDIETVKSREAGTVVDLGGIY